MNRPERRLQPGDWEQPEITQEDHAAARAFLKLAKPMPCTYCGEDMIYYHEKKHPTQDHIWPQFARSIAEGRTGRVWCCSGCNIEKNDMLPSEWLRVLEAKRASPQSIEEPCKGDEVSAARPDGGMTP